MRGVRRSLFASPSKDKEHTDVDNSVPIGEVSDVGFPHLLFCVVFVLL
jgi:hypothetical protein